MKRIFLTLVGAAAILTACNKEMDEPIVPSANKVTISPSITLTRATDMNFEQGDRIGLTIIRADESLHAENALLIHNGNVFTGNTNWYTETNKESHLVAYHPYDESGAPTSFTVALDQSGEGFGKSDLLGASKPNVAPSASSIGMTFKHLLTKINVNVTNESNADVVSIALQGSIPTADVDLKVRTVEVDGAAAPANIIAQQATKNVLYRAIVVPQQVAFTVVVTTSNGKTLSQPLATATLRQGAQYNVDVAISAATELEATISGEIFGWTDEGVLAGVIADDEATPSVAAGGFFVANEDWMGHDNGTVNYFRYTNGTYTPEYRIYRAANPAESDWFATTTQFATIWGDYAYFCSKNGSGNRFVVADAKTMQKRAAFATIGGDGRAFVGIDDTKGYVGHSNGIVVFDIANLQLGSSIAGVSGDIGAMCLAGGRVFAVKSNGLYVIDAQANTVEQTMSGSYYTLTRSKDGNVWVATSAGLVKIDPQTLEKETFPAYTMDRGIWGAWNAGSLCASTQTNTLYWTVGGGMFGGANKIVKYDIDTQTANTSFYALGTSSYGKALEFYAAALRVDPLTDELILMARHGGWGLDAGAYNWIYKLDANGTEKESFEYFGGNEESGSWGAGNPNDGWNGNYFWFPAMPFFEDANKPQILLNQVLVEAGETKNIDLSEKIVDYDNTFASIQTGATLANDDLATVSVYDGILTVVAGTEAGSTTCTLTAISNGVRVEKTVRIDIY